MTEQEIVSIIGKDRVLAGHKIVCPNVNLLLKGQQDMISVTGRGVLIEYEVKISRSDFKRDAKKLKSTTMANPEYWPDQVPNQFYYVVPAGLITREEIPAWAGLIWIDNSLDPSAKVVILKKTAPVIHKYKHDIQKILKKVTTLYQQRQFLGACLMTYKNKESKATFERLYQQTPVK